MEYPGHLTVETGAQAEVNIEEFEKMVALETIGDLAGVGLISREMEEQYPFIKLK